MPVRLLRQLDALAKASYMSRSQVIKLALIEWINTDKKRASLAGKAVGRPDPERHRLKKLLTPEQHAVLKEYKRGLATFKDLLAVGIAPEMTIELMDMGEL